jgi:hypothetical protein
MIRALRLAALQSLVACVGLLAGCGGEVVEGPPTVPFKGKIEVTKGGKVQDLADRSVVVEFQSVEQPDVKAFGAILEDGSFTMTTQVNDKGKSGVLPGTHRVRLNTDDNGARFISPKFLEYQTSGITVKAPSDEEVVIQIWK